MTESTTERPATAHPFVSAPPAPAAIAQPIVGSSVHLFLGDDDRPIAAFVRRVYPMQAPQPVDLVALGRGGKVGAIDTFSLDGVPHESTAMLYQPRWAWPRAVERAP